MAVVKTNVEVSLAHAGYLPSNIAAIKDNRWRLFRVAQRGR
jgi:hypothetical protein